MEQMEGVSYSSSRRSVAEGLQRSDGSGHSGSEEADEASEDDDASEKSEDDDATIEKKAKIRQFTSEIKALELAVEKKRAGFTGGNPIMMVNSDFAFSDEVVLISGRNDSRKRLQDCKGIFRRRSPRDKHLLTRWRLSRRR